MHVYLDPDDTITLTTGSDSQTISYSDVVPPTMVEENYEHVEFDESDKPEYFRGIPDEHLKKLSAILSDKELAESLMKYLEDK